VINGLAAASVHDYPELRLHCIDLDDVTLATGNAMVLDSLAVDMARGSDAAVAYRGGERWVQGFDRLVVDRPDSGDLALRKRGVYLITGGLGKIGLALAEDLATRVAARLALTTRSTLPPRDRWDAVTDAGLAATIAGLRRIEQAGGEVAVVTADPADPAQVIAAVAEVESRFGRIDGVVHAAGITSGTTFGPMSTLMLDAYREQLAAKAGGALALATALDGRAVDFCVLMSSLSSAIGAQGFAPYACANAFLDALAASRERTTGTRWLAIGFDGWRFGGYAAGSALAEMAMLPAEGIDAFYRALSVPGVPRVLVCTTDLNSRRLTPEPHTVDAPHGGAESTGGAMAEGEGPRNSTERAIHAVWRAMFGVEVIGRDDDFFQLGGHSLLALRISARLTKELGVTISAAMLMQHGTVAKLAAMADELRNVRSEEETEALLGIVENLSEAEVAELLGGGLNKESHGA
jgi:NAD(P)-dependent dehydrogenase (short-subunit alcohol dehydrogenase family)/acyl carrier protein